MSPKERKQADIVRLLRQGVTQAKAIETVGVSSATFYNWKKRDEAFSAVVEAAIEEGKNLRLAATEAPEETAGDTRLDTFISVFVSNGGVAEEACQASGITLQQLASLIDPIASLYNPKFHKLYSEAQKVLEIRAIDAIASNIKRRGNGHTADAKWLLERRLPSEYGNRLKVEEEKDKKPAISEEQALVVLQDIFGAKTSESIN